MKTTIASLAGAVCIGLLATTAGAAPLGSGAFERATATEQNVVRVHGIHVSCRRDKHGWHRSHLWGRERCTPSRHKRWYQWWR